MKMTKAELNYARPISWGELETLQIKFQGQIMYLAGGDYHPKAKDNVSILIDLQELDLDQAAYTEDGITLGGLINLKQLGDALELPDLQEAISIEAGANLRNSLSLTNYVKSSTGRSVVQICLNAMEAEYSLTREEITQTHSEPLKTKLADDFIEDIWIPSPISLAFASVGRSPKDQPVVALAASKRSDDRIHVACGGSEGMWSEFDIHPGEEDGENRIRQVYKEINDEWAGAEYRQEIAAILLSRCLQKLSQDSYSEEES